LGGRRFRPSLGNDSPRSEGQGNMETESKFRPNLQIFGVPRHEPGWLYVIKNADLFKIGKTTNPKRRLLNEARTWLPDMELVGVKPFWNISALERFLLCGAAPHWYAGEWHCFPDSTWDFFFEDFSGFYDDDRDMNSVDFIYWVNGSGLSEVIAEQNHQKVSLRTFQQRVGVGKKGRHMPPPATS
jgi:hypothetical protein